MLGLRNPADRSRAVRAPSTRPSIERRARSRTTRLCVTQGRGRRGRDPPSRPCARSRAARSGDAAAADVHVSAATPSSTRALANGELRRQIGLKLRAQDGCNVVYVMWRLDPKPKLEISVKCNPGKRTHEECGADGYTKIKPACRKPLPALEVGTTHTLRAEIVGDELFAWVDDALRLARAGCPTTARAISRPRGHALRQRQARHRRARGAALVGGATACKATSTTTDAPRIYV